MDKELITRFKNICGSFLRRLAENPFPAIVFLFLVVLVLGGFIFYRYGFLVESSAPKTNGKTTQFQEELYQQILKEWQQRDEKFEAADSRKYINPFQEKR